MNLSEDMKKKLGNTEETNVTDTELSDEEAASVSGGYLPLERRKDRPLQSPFTNEGTDPSVVPFV